MADREAVPFCSVPQSNDFSLTQSFVPGMAKFEPQQTLVKLNIFKVFGAPLHVVMVHQGRGFIPEVVEKCIRSLWNRIATVEGIFRVEGQQSHLERLIQEFNKGGSPDLDKEPPILVAHLLKKFFFELPDPIMTYELYDDFLGTREFGDDEERLYKLRLLCDSLPDANHALLESFFTFLAHVLSFEEQTKMGLVNLATIFAPSFLKPKKLGGLDQLSALGHQKEVLIDIVSNASKMFGIMRLGSIEDRFNVEHQTTKIGGVPVKFCIDKATGETFTTKIIEKQEMTKEEFKKLQEEINILKKVRHPNIMSLRAVCQTDSVLYLVMDYAGGGHLGQVIQEKGALPEKQGVFVIFQLVKAMEYLHALKIRHQDLGLDKLLLNTPNELSIKLADFGMRDVMEKTLKIKVEKDKSVTPSPEVISGDSFGFPADMWGVGCITFTLLSAKKPFDFATPQEMHSAILKGSFDMSGPEWQKLSQTSTSFISGLLAVDPKKRLTATQCLRHPWLHQAMVIEKKSESGVAHTFHKMTYKSPTWCDVCTKFLWGITKQGYQCSVCRIDVHGKCRKLTGDTCVCLKSSSYSKEERKKSEEHSESQVRMKVLKKFEMEKLKDGMK